MHERIGSKCYFQKVEENLAQRSCLCVPCTCTPRCWTRSPRAVNTLSPCTARLSLPHRPTAGGKETTRALHCPHHAPRYLPLRTTNPCRPTPVREPRHAGVPHALPASHALPPSAATARAPPSAPMHEKEDPNVALSSHRFAAIKGPCPGSPASPFHPAPELRCRRYCRPSSFCLRATLLPPEPSRAPPEPHSTFLAPSPAISVAAFAGDGEPAPRSTPHRTSSALDSYSPKTTGGLLISFAPLAHALMVGPCRICAASPPVRTEDHIAKPKILPGP
uniref:Uncharacterized protein n=1 Tax=Setaria viridis TaxID=4556 RepID=A0A4U6WB53_SETVI|nr:hypothetical protein SEVIR_1G154100v2 [Setaria viridis]